MAINDSPLWSTFLAKLERSEGGSVDIFNRKVLESKIVFVDQQ